MVRPSVAIAAVYQNKTIAILTNSVAEKGKYCKCTCMLFVWLGHQIYFLNNNYAIKTAKVALIVNYPKINDSVVIS